MSSPGPVTSHASSQHRVRHSQLRILIISLACAAFAVHPSSPTLAQSPGASSDHGRGTADGGRPAGTGNGPSEALPNTPNDTEPHPGKLDAALRRQAQNGGAERIPVVVTKEQGQALDSVSQAIANVGGGVRHALPHVNAVLADVRADKLLKLTSSSSVRALSFDAPLQPVDGNVVGPSTAPTSTAYTLRAALGLPAMNPGATGVGVAVIDSGISPDVDFAGRITAFYDFTADGVATAPIDPYGHGTHIAGIIASSGAGQADAQYRGVATHARLIGLRVLDGEGAGKTSQVLQAIDFAIAQRDALGIDVINLSLGHPIYEPADTDPLVGAVEAAVRSGIVVVASAGNFGYNRTTGQTGYAGITSPGNAPSAITVGALRTANTTMRDDDTVAPYSSRGPSWYDATAKPDLVAPGDGIISNATPDSTLSTMYPSVRVDASHIRLNGTSMAAAVTSGAAALVIEASRTAHPLAPSLTPNTIKAILQFSATHVGFTSAAPPDPLIQGAGAINVPAALDLARAIDPSQPVGADWLSNALSPFTTYGDRALPWTQAINWRDTLLSGGVLELNRTAWSLSVPWGADISWTSDVIPASNIVWGAGIRWDVNVVWGADLVGTCTGGETFTWGSSDGCPNGETFTVGTNIDPATTFWTSLATLTTNGETFTWGSNDPPSASASQH
jgi:serine protease AprX